MADFYIKQGDLLPRISSTLRDSTGAVVPLTNATVEFHMWAKGSSLTKVSGAAQIVSEAGGTVYYQWAGNDTDTPGRYLAEWEVTFPSSLPETHPSNGYLVIDILPARN